MLEAAAAGDGSEARAALEHARAMQGLDAGEVAALMAVEDPGLIEEIYAAARYVKEEIYGSRLVLFAPLYVSNYCKNECLYCAFRAQNTGLRRRALTMEEVRRETEQLIRQGHKRLLVVAGEEYPAGQGFDYILESIGAIYDTRCERGEIRRVNVNVAPLAVEQYRELKAAKIGTYQIFQETFHRETYARVHTGGMKRDFDWRLSAVDRAMQGGIDDVGVGVLFGLYDWKFEVLALLENIEHLEREYGVGPHTISVPRLEPALGSSLASQPLRPVSDADFRKLVAILRLAVPYTGIIMSTRENPELRRETFALGVSQISAGSRTNPGGYAELGSENLEAQFNLGDHRGLDEVVRDVASLGYLPSFCTGCYRLGRTGKDFMDLAKPGEIKRHCAPNGLSTFLEYLLDYASEATRLVGEKLIRQKLAELDPEVRRISEGLLAQVRAHRRDVLV